MTAARARPMKSRRGGAVAVALVLISLFVGGADSVMAAPTPPMHFSYITLEDGLSQNNVQSILQDSSGYMWFATESGLNRYDGYEIHRYSRARGDRSGFENDFVWVVAEDENRDLWLATQGGGVVRWNRASDTFTSFRHDSQNADSIASDDIRTLLINADGTIWVGTRDRGLDLLEPATGQVKHFRHDPGNAASLSNDRVYALLRDSSGELWVGTDGGVNKLAPAADGFVRYQHDSTAPASLSDNKVRTLYEDRAGVIWIGTSSGGLNRLDRSGSRFSRFRHDPADVGSLSNDKVRVIFEDNAGRFWIGTANGLNLLDRETGTVNRYQHSPVDPQGLNDSYINSIYQDRGGLLWVGTRSAGVNKWNPRSWSLGHYMQPWLSGTDVTSFADDGDGSVWVGTLGAGLAKINTETYEVRSYVHRPGDSGSISDSKVMSLLIDRQGTLWIGTMSGGLNRMDPATGNIRTYRHNKRVADSLGADGVMAIFEDDQGSLWFGTYGGGVSVFDRETESFTNYVNDPDDAASLSDQRASAILQDSNGAIWIGTFGGGLNLFDADSGSFHRFRSNPDDPSSLADNTVYSMHLDANGNIWIGTAGGGLDMIVDSTADPADVRFINYAQNEGLPSNVINGIQSDSSNRLWLSMNYGLTRFDPTTLEAKIFHRGHGLQGEEFNYAAHHRAADGKLYFGGANGFNAFNPDRVEESHYAPNVVMTSFQKLNRPAITDVPYDQLTNITLTHKDHVVNFSFAALDFTEPLQNSYSYMLEGFDDDWIDLGAKRHVTYTNLDGGSYRLKLKTVTSDGVAVDDAFSIPVQVAQAPWATPWAYSLYAASGLILLLLLWRLERRKYRREAEYSARLEQDVASRTRQLEERNEELLVASRAKSSFLARMSHEIRTPMNGMLGMTQLLMGTELEDKQYRFTQTIKRSAESLLDIINDILDFSKIEAGRLELDNVEFNLSELVDETVELFAGEAGEKGVELMCATPSGKTIAAIGDPLRLKQILVNLLGNAVKFTREGEVVLRYSLVDEQSDELKFHFEVSDTGVGIHKDNLAMIFDSFSQEDGSTSRRFGGTGLGLAICKQLIEMMGGNIGVQSKPGKGSRFWFTLSLKKAGSAWLSKNASPRLANLRVLVVDDNATNTGIVAGYLSALGIDADSVATPYDALKQVDAAQATPYDIVLVDANVGDMTGLEITRAIKSNPKILPVKVVLLNPVAAEVAEQHWRSAGVDDCLPKPIRQSMLYERLLTLTATSGSCSPRQLPRRQAEQPLEKLAAHVLLVEDNPVNQAVAIGMLEQLGCDTVVAINGQDAVTHCSNEDFDVVLMDCEMPVMDGFAATAAIRGRQGPRNEVPIIALTANAIEGDQDRCIEAGMQDYLSKPITVEKLHGMISKWVPADYDETSEESNDLLDSIDSASLNNIRELQGVGGDRMVRRVVELYLTSSSMLVEDLRMGLLSDDAEAVRQSAHALKSSSQNVGASGLASFSQQLEEMGRNGKLVDTEINMGVLDQLYPRTVVALKEVIKQPVAEC